MIIRSERIVTPTKVMDGHLRVESGRIAEVCEGRCRDHPQQDFGQAWVLPGFIDLHMHGLGPYEPLDVAGLVGMAGMQPRFGTVAFLPTGAAMSVAQIIDLGKHARQAQKECAGIAKIAGVHLEGPFINPQSSGAMDGSTRRPIDLDEARLYIDAIGDLLKIMTFSPELPGGIELIRLLRQNGVVASLGHSIAAGESLASYVEAGLQHVVHLFNAFQPSGLKEPGVLRAGLLEHILLNDALTCEVICDLQHVAPEIVQLAARVLGPDRLIAITDSLPGAGQPDGVYAFPNGGQYQISGGAARLQGGPFAGCLAGSVLTMNKAFVNLIHGCRIDPVWAAKYTASNAAKVLGREKQTGTLETDKCADIAVIDDTGQCLATCIDGAWVYRCQTEEKTL